MKGEIFLSARYQYSRQLKELERYILDMGSMMEQLLNSSIEALVDQNVELARESVEKDEAINNFAFDIEDKCVRLIATEQPVAKDLRLIHASLKIITDIERMADHGVDISKIAIRLANTTYMKAIIDITKMADIGLDMVRDALNAYVEKDVVLATDVCTRDDVVDDIYESLFDELLEYMKIDSENIYQSTNFLLVAKYLERVADHATNICEWIIYIVTGEKKELN